ncbi:MAG: hypothetical protein PHE83_15025, partial [Opitutaceae bacterium]|nr:hypothetical protein [Opitutaceae bacterium]
KPVSKDIVRRTGEFFKAAGALARINAYIPKLVEIDTKSGPRQAKTLRDQDALLEAWQHEAEAVQARLREAQEKTDRLFKEWRESPDRYRMVQYVPGGPLVSPSGTRSYLEGLIRNQRPAWPEIQDAANSRLARLDALLAREVTNMPAGPALDPNYTTERLVRGGAQFLLGRQLLLSLCRRRGLPAPSLDHPPLTMLPDFTADDAHKAFLSRLNEVARRIGMDHHSASMEELLALYQRARVMIRAGEDPNEEPVPLFLPASSTLVPPTANFLEREAHHKGIRSLKDMAHEQEELLRKISEVLLREPAPTLPLYHW